MKHRDHPQSGVPATSTWAVEAAFALVALACAAIAIAPLVERARARAVAVARVDRLIERAPLPAVRAFEAAGVERLGAPAERVSLAPLTDLEGVLAEPAPLEPDRVSWGLVGGCGVGGGGGGGGVRWMGRRAPGGVLEVELMASVSASESTDSTSTTVKLSSEIPGRLNLGLQIPYVSLTGMDDNYFEQFGTELEVNAAGVGDLTLMLSRKFGIQGDTVAGLSIGLPTGVHDDMYGSSYVLPRSFQIGKGVPTVGGTLEYTLTKDWGMITYGAGLNLNGGTNDIDNGTGNTYDLYAYLGYKTEALVHSVGVKLSRGLSKDINAGAFEADQSRTRVTLQYGLELSFIRMSPVFIGLTQTIAEISSANSTGLAVGVVMSF